MKKRVAIYVRVSTDKHNIFILKEDKMELGILENPKINNIF